MYLIWAVRAFQRRHQAWTKVCCDACNRSAGNTLTIPATTSGGRIARAYQTSSAPPGGSQSLAYDVSRFLTPSQLCEVLVCFADLPQAQAQRVQGHACAGKSQLGFPRGEQPVSRTLWVDEDHRPHPRQRRQVLPTRFQLRPFAIRSARSAPHDILDFTVAQRPVSRQLRSAAALARAPAAGADDRCETAQRASRLCCKAWAWPPRPSHTGLP